MKSSEITVKSSEIKWNQVKSSEIKWNKVKSSEIKWNQVKSSETKWNKVKSSEIKRVQANPPPPPTSYPTLVGFIGIYIYIYI